MHVDVFLFRFQHVYCRRLARDGGWILGRFNGSCLPSFLLIRVKVVHDHQRFLSEGMNNAMS